jgi:hypothetical protein
MQPEALTTVAARTAAKRTLRMVSPYRNVETTRSRLISETYGPQVEPVTPEPDTHVMGGVGQRSASKSWRAEG